ncbi:DUF4198 domain-containing protein [Phenylobacterium sp.]|uniref:DUF4198 domain-containing protein n=1 Tax=Phenylobacterium sp. TaxID=1871053 RepID=UPI0039834C53
MRHLASRLAVASVLATTLLASGPARAHDFWVQPARFWVAAGETVPFSFQVGHGPDRERWGVEIRRILRFDSLGPAGASDRRGDLSARAEQDHALTFADPGVQVVALQSGYAESALPALRFNSYLRDEGLTPAQQQRARTRTEDRPGREIYSRRAKALVQVGPPSSRAQPHVTRPVGLTLEIVPEVNPYAPGRGQGLPVRVLFEGRPLAGALIDLTNLEADGKPVEGHHTDRAGRATFRVPNRGLWQLNVVWTKPIAGDRRGDFDTTFSSLTFGYPRRAP